MRPRWYRPARHPDLEEDPALAGRPADETPDFDDEQDRAQDRAEAKEAREERERTAIRCAVSLAGWRSRGNG